MTHALPDGVRAGAPPAPAFADVAERHLDTVFRYLGHLVRDRDLAEDLTGETFVRALAAWRRYDPRRGTPAVWLCTIARTVALDHFRSERRRLQRETRYAADAPGSALDAPTPGLSPGLARALGRLSDAEREVVALRVVLELSGVEAAAVLGISPSACSTMLHRALTKLRQEVGDDGRD